MVIASTRLVKVIKKTSTVFSRRKILNLFGNSCLVIKVCQFLLTLKYSYLKRSFQDDCPKKCKDQFHIHGSIEYTDRISFIETLNGLESLPSLEVISSALKRLELSKVKEGSEPCLVWNGYFVGKFTREDLKLLYDLQLFKSDIRKNILKEEEMKNEPLQIPPGLPSLDGRQSKFYSELWHEAIIEKDLEMNSSLAEHLSCRELTMAAWAREAEENYR